MSRNDVAAARVPRPGARRQESLHGGIARRRPPGRQQQPHARMIVQRRDSRARPRPPTTVGPVQLERAARRVKGRRIWRQQVQPDERRVAGQRERRRDVLERLCADSEGRGRGRAVGAVENRHGRPHGGRQHDARHAGIDCRRQFGAPDAKQHGPDSRPARRSAIPERHGRIPQANAGRVVLEPGQPQPLGLARLEMAQLSKRLVIAQPNVPGRQECSDRRRVGAELAGLFHEHSANSHGSARGQEPAETEAGRRIARIGSHRGVERRFRFANASQRQQRIAGEPPGLRTRDVRGGQQDASGARRCAHHGRVTSTA